MTAALELHGRAPLRRHKPKRQAKREEPYVPYEFPRQCECGCGEAVNVELVTAVQLIRMGYKRKEIAERLGITPVNLKQKLAHPSRFRVGHGGRVNNWETRICRVCGRQWRMVDHRPLSVCTYCRQRGRGGDDEWAQLYDERDERTRVYTRTQRAAMSAERQRLKEQRERARKWIAKHGWPQRGPVPVVVLTEEMQALVAEQEKDARTFQVQFVPSLDNLLDAEDDGSFRAASMGAVQFDREDDEWAFYAERGRRHRSHAR